MKDREARPAAREESEGAAPGKVQRMRRREAVQRKGGEAEGGYVQELAAQGVAGGGESLPFMDVIAASFGRHDVSGVQAHTDGAAQEAAHGMGAQAYATGDHVAFGGAPDLHTAAHEAAHVVQQRAGVQLKGGVGESGDAYEQHADAVADAVVRGESAERLLDAHGGGGTAADGVQKKEIVKTGGPSHTEPDANVLAMKISRFVEYTGEQADWSTHFTGPEKPKLQQLLHDLLASPALGAGLRPFTVTEVLARSADMVALRAYSAAVQDAAGVPTAKVKAPATIARAVQIGEALPKLEAAVGSGGALYHITSPTSVDSLIAAGRVDEFVKYCAARQPQWDAPDGKEFESFLAMSIDFYKKYPKLTDVRNLHHFDDTALARLDGDMGGKNAGKPLALVLHSGLDHSGAFHHDGKFTTAITSNPHRMVMIEGKSTLAEIETMLPTIASTYGGGVINQVMIAGHGNSRAMDLAGTTKMGTNAEGAPAIEDAHDDLELDSNQVATERLFKALLANMGGKDSRIVLNGCLTASNDLKIDPANPDPPEKQVADQLAAKGSLAETLRAMAKKQGVATTVLGANASFPEGPDLIDGAGNFDVKWSKDPALTAPDRKEYIKKGIEPTGVLRAVLEFWRPPGPDKDWLDAVNDRLTRPTNNWDGAIITKALAEIAKKPADAQFVSDLAGAVEAVALGYFSDDAKASKLGKVPVGLQPLLFGAVEGSTGWPGEEKMAPIGFYSVWGKLTAAKYDALIAHLTAESFTTSMAKPNLDWTWLDDAALAKLLPAAARAAPTRGHLVIACANVKTAGRSRVAIDFLKEYAKANGNTFPSAADVPGIADDNTVDAILTAIGLGAAKAPGSGGGGSGDTEVEANVDQDKDGKNDRYIERTAGWGEVVNCSVLRVHHGPGNAAKEIGFLKAGETVFVQGMRHGWCSIDFKGTTGYVWNKFLKIT